MAKVTIYTTPTCVYCKMAKKYFQEHGVEYQEKDVAMDLKAREEMIEKTVKLSGNSGRVYLPPTWVGHSVKIIRID